MFFTVSSQISSAAASYWARQFELCSAFNAKALASMTKLSELNTRAMREAVQNSSTALQQLLTSGGTAPSDRAQLAIDGARAYGRQVAGIAFDMRTESTHLVQNSLNSVHTQFDSYLDDLTKGAPETASGALQLVRAAIGNVNKGYDQLIMTSDQAAQAVVDSLEGSSHPLH